MTEPAAHQRLAASLYGIWAGRQRAKSGGTGRQSCGNRVKHGEEQTQQPGHSIRITEAEYPGPVNMRKALAGGARWASLSREFVGLW